MRSMTLSSNANRSRYSSSVYPGAMPSLRNRSSSPSSACRRNSLELGTLGLLRVVRGAGEARQDRPARLQHERAAPRDLDGVFERLGQVGEKRRHFLPALEIVIRRQPETDCRRKPWRCGRPPSARRARHSRMARERTPRWSQPEAHRTRTPGRSSGSRAGGRRRRAAAARYRAGRRRDPLGLPGVPRPRPPRRRISPPCRSDRRGPPAPERAISPSVPAST